MKKLLSFLLALCMVFVLLPDRSARADGPNEIYVHNYTELQEALQNYGYVKIYLDDSDGGFATEEELDISLSRDVYLASDWTISESVTINTSSYGAIIDTYGKYALTVRGSLYINDSKTQARDIIVYGTITLPKNVSLRAETVEWMPGSHLIGATLKSDGTMDVAGFMNPYWGKWARTGNGFYLDGDYYPDTELTWIVHEGAELLSVNSALPVRGGRSYVSSGVFFTPKIVFRAVGTVGFPFRFEVTTEARLLLEGDWVSTASTDTKTSTGVWIRSGGSVTVNGSLNDGLTNINSGSESSRPGMLTLTPGSQFIGRFYKADTSDYGSGIICAVANPDGSNGPSYTRVLKYGSQIVNETYDFDYICNNRSEFSTHYIDENYQIVRSWAPDGVFVSFDANGGSDAHTPELTDENGRLRLPALPSAVRYGYKFLGWFTQRFGGEQVTVDNVFTHNTVLYGQWEESHDPVDEVTLDVSNLTLQVGGTQMLTASLSPENAAGNPVLWFSDDPAVAVVSDSGEVTATGAGTTVITAVAGRAGASCAVTVEAGETPPEITSQPADQTVAEGTTATFKVTASGTGLTYQWQYKTPTGSWKNLSSFTGYNTDTLKVPATLARSGNQYRCRVTGGGQTLISRAALLTVTEAFAITEQPQDVTGTAGTNVTFHVGATGSNLTYQWQYKTPTGSWKNLSSFTGYNTDTLTVPATVARSGNQYRCRVTGGGQTLTSRAALLTVTEAFAITEQPQDVTGTAGTNVIFHVGVTGSNLTYQWQYKTPTGSWKNLGSFTGYNTDTLTVPATLARSGNQYRCRVTGGSETLTSRAALLTVTEAFAVTEQPQDVTGMPGTNVTFHVGASGSNLTYQWQYLKPGGNWTNCGSFTGRSTATLKVPVTAARNGYKFRCVVTSGTQSVTSSAATLTVFAVTAQPQDVTGVVGTNVTFHVGAAGSDLTYQWQYLKPGGSWTNCGSFTGRSTATLKVPVTAARNGYKFRCVVTSGTQSVTSNAATLTVFAITAQPQDVTAAAGTNASFTVTARGSDLTYQWQYKKPSGNWTNCGSFTGYNTAALKVPATTARNGYQFRCIVTCQGTAIESAAATLTVG